jgi:hypothetical protein
MKSLKLVLLTGIVTLMCLVLGKGSANNTTRQLHNNAIKKDTVYAEYNDINVCLFCMPVYLPH